MAQAGRLRQRGVERSRPEMVFRFSRCSAGIDGNT